MKFISLITLVLLVACSGGDNSEGVGPAKTGGPSGYNPGGPSGGNPSASVEENLDPSEDDYGGTPPGTGTDGGATPAYVEDGGVTPVYRGDDDEETVTEEAEQNET